MNISNINNTNAAKIYAETSKKLNSDKLQKNRNKGNKGKYSANDTVLDKGGVNISREAKNMNVLDFVKERIKTDMSKDIPADKINQLKNLVKSGDYHVDTDALASAVICGKA